MITVKHHVKQISWDEKLGNIIVHKIDLYDERDYSDEEILEAVNDGEIETFVGVVVCYKRDYELAFRSLKNIEVEE